MKKFLQILLLTVAMAAVAAAYDAVPAVPEIGVGTAASTVGLLAGGMLLMRGRRNRKP